MHTIYEQNIPKRTLQKIMTNKDLSAYSKTIVICFIICLFKRGKKMQANCILSFFVYLFISRTVGKQFPAVKLFSRNCYLGKQKILSKYIGLLQMFLHRSILTTFYIFSKEIVQKFKTQRCLNNLHSKDVKCCQNRKFFFKLWIVRNTSK